MASNLKAKRKCRKWRAIVGSNPTLRIEYNIIADCLRSDLGLCRQASCAERPRSGNEDLLEVKATNSTILFGMKHKIN